MKTIGQTTSGAAIEIDLDAGCRLSSLEIAGHQLLVQSGPSSIEWGAYPMAPYAGRIRNGRLDFDGSAHRLPINLGDHAIHGTVFDVPWTPESDRSFVVDLGEAWPFAGFARQSYELTPGALHMRLEVHTTDAAMPASAGWHPWFRRGIGGVTAVLDFRPGYMLMRDATGITTTTRMDPPPGPWDDCFGDVETSPSIRWPGIATLTLDSTCSYWVAFTERDHAICLEPQTAPPNALNSDPFIVRPGEPLVAQTAIRWELEGHPGE